MSKIVKWTALIAMALPGVGLAQPHMSPAQLKETLERAPVIVPKTLKGSPLHYPTISVCAGQTAAGYALVDVQTNFTVCSGTFDDVWILTDLRGASAGQSTSVCASGLPIAGWVVTNQTTDFTRCGRNQTFNNIAIIKKL